METALSEGSILPGEVQYVNAHGTATRANDEVETRILRRVFSDHARHLSISSTKPFTGHLLGACGALEAATTLLAMQHSFVPPTLNLSCPDVECDMDLVPCSGKPKRIDIAMSNNYSFGGRNSSLLFKHVTDNQPLTGKSP
jgi:3-oxoacyl-[acyl-carrier-protein] synthase II